MGERIANFIQFIYWITCDQVIKAMFITLMIRNPCKSKKCLVRASCTAYCGEREYYLKFCDRDEKIIFQRICAISIIFAIITVSFGIITMIFK